jgi:hypothetical protein
MVFSIVGDSLLRELPPFTPKPFPTALSPPHLIYFFPMASSFFHRHQDAHSHHKSKILLFPLDSLLFPEFLLLCGLFLGPQAVVLFGCLLPATPTVLLAVLSIPALLTAQSQLFLLFTLQSLLTGMSL